MRTQKKTIAKSLEQHKTIIGQPWDNHGKNLGKQFEKPFDTHGETTDTHWKTTETKHKKTIANNWKTLENHLQTM